MSLLLLPILPTSINILFAAALFAGIGNSINLSHHEKSNLEAAFTKNLSSENISKNLNKTISDIISSTIVNNRNEIKSYLQAKNKMAFNFGNQPEDCPQPEGGNDYEFTGLTQGGEVTQESVIEMENKTNTKIQAEVLESLSNIFVNQDDIFNKINQSYDDFQTAMDAGINGIKDMAGDATKVLNTAGMTNYGGFGKSQSASQNINNEVSLKDNLAISDENIIEEEDLRENNVEDILSVENINTMMNQIFLANEIDIQVGQCISGATISNINQLNVADLKMESTMLNTIVNDVGVRMTKSIVKIFEKIDGKSNAPNKVIDLALATGAAIVAKGGLKDGESAVALTPAVTTPTPTPTPTTSPATNLSSSTNPPRTIEPSPPETNESGGLSKIIFYVGIGLGILLLIILIIKLTKKKRRPRRRPRMRPRPRSRPEPEETYEENDYDNQLDYFEDIGDEMNNMDENFDNYNYLKKFM